MVGLKTAVQQDREDKRVLQEDRDSVTHGLGRTEPELDSGNPFQTLKLKMSEGLRENYRTSVEWIVDILPKGLHPELGSNVTQKELTESATTDSEMINHAV